MKKYISFIFVFIIYYSYSQVNISKSLGLDKNDNSLFFNIEVINNYSDTEDNSFSTVVSSSYKVGDLSFKYYNKSCSGLCNFFFDEGSVLYDDFNEDDITDIRFYFIDAGQGDDDIKLYYILMTNRGISSYEFTLSYSLSTHNYYLKDSCDVFLKALPNNLVDFLKKEYTLIDRYVKEDLNSDD